MPKSSQFDRALADLRQEIDVLQAALARMEKAKAAKPARKPKARKGDPPQHGEAS